MDSSLQRLHSSDTQSSLFQPHQIVCLDHGNAQLYAEVVQLVEIKHAYWVHPLVLRLRSPSADPLTASICPPDFTLHDLRQGADLVWPTTLFRAALDVEFIPLLSMLHTAEPLIEETAAAKLLARQLLNQFVRQMWQAHSEVFSA